MPQIDAPIDQLKASERRAREIVEGLRDAFMSLDAQWRITGCNAQAEVILGRSRIEVLGQPLWEVIGVPSDSSLGETGRRVLETGEPEDGEFALHLNGVERLLSVRGFPLEDGIGVVARDITELRVAEQRLAECETRFHELAEGAPAPTWTTGADGAIQYFNTAMLHEFGSSKSEVMEGAWERRVHPDDLPAFQQALRKAETGHSGFAHVVRMQRSDGSWRTLKVSGSPRYDINGAFAGHIGMATDITDVLTAQERQELLIHELNHRVRNTLATVQAMVRQTLKDSSAAKGTLDLLNDRLMALAAAHDVLTREHWEGAELFEMACDAVRPFDPDRSRIAIAGPKVRLPPGPALAFFLAMNELATNAVRHGALSAPEGRVSVNWTKDDDVVDLEWRESGGPPVSPPAKKGFGSRLLGAGLTSELGAPATIIYAPEGLVCRIHFAVRESYPDQAMLASPEAAGAGRPT